MKALEVAKVLGRKTYERIVPPKVHSNAPLEYRTFARSRLTIPEAEFKRRIDEFRALQGRSDPGKDYRGAFYFQFPATFDGVASVKEYYHASPLRSIELMQLAATKVSFDGKKVLSLGCHNGGELFWLYEHTTAQVLGVDENPHFVDYARFLSASYGLDDRIRVERADAIGHLLDTADQYDVIIAHGLLYMLWDPLLFLRALRARLGEGGVATVEIYLIPGEKPLAQYMGDGSGWGDTFAYTQSFLDRILPAYGFAVEHVLDYRGRKLFILRKAPLTRAEPAVERMLERARSTAAKPRGASTRIGKNGTS